MVGMHKLGTNLTILNNNRSRFTIISKLASSSTRSHFYVEVGQSILRGFQYVTCLINEASTGDLERNA